MAEIAEARDELVATTRRLVAIPSPNPPGDVGPVADAAAALLEAIDGVTLERFETAPGIVNLVARITGAAGPGRRIVLNGHLDTFPLGDESGWTVPPFGGLLREGRLYGRGVSDMKAGIAASIIAARVLAGHRGAWWGELVVTLAGDEENMGSLGTRWLLENVPHARGDAMLCGDVGSPLVVRFGEKGLVWVRIEAVGSPAHGAHVHKGTNAIDRLRAALDVLKAVENLPIDAPEEVRVAIAAARDVSEPLSGAGEADTLRRPTVNIGLIAGGSSPNLVPAQAFAEADIRLPVGLTTSAVESFLAHELGRLPGIAYEVFRRYEPTFTSPGHEIIRRVTSAGETVQGRSPVPNMRVGASDARLYRLFDVPSAVFGPTPFNMGAPDEHILVDELVVVAQVHALTAFEYLSADPDELKSW